MLKCNFIHFTAQLGSSTVENDVYANISALIAMRVKRQLFIV